MTISRDNCWSIRDCFERADRLNDEADELVRAGRLSDGSGTASLLDMPLDTLARRQRELIAHLCVNLKAGFATPMTPKGMATARPSMPPVMYSQPTPMPKPLRAVKPAPLPPAPKPQKPAKAQKPPPQVGYERLGAKAAALSRAKTRADAAARGLLGLPQMLQALGMTQAGFYKARNAGRIEAPVEYQKGLPFWKPEQAERARIRKARA